MKPNLPTMPFAGATALLLALAATGCGGGGSGSRDAILGGPGQAGMLPMVTAMAPANGATGVPVNTRMITAQFNIPVGTGTASMTVTTPAPGASPAGTVALDGAGRVATFTLDGAASFSPGAVYTATVTGARSAATGLAMASPWAGTFTMGPYISATQPRVALTLPATTTPGPTPAVPTTTSVNATFTAPMNPATLPVAAFTLVSASGAAMTGSVSYAVGSRTVTFEPASPLLPATTYTATIRSTASDLAGLRLAGNMAPPPAASDYIWSFTTASAPDGVAPRLVLEYPADMAVAVPLNTAVSAGFSKDMAISSLLFTLQALPPGAGAPLAGGMTYDPLTRTATFVPAVNLSGSTTYTAAITGARDLSGNALATGSLPDPWTFTTGTALAPSRNVDLGAAAAFGIMATSAITNTGATTINGDVSLDPGTSMTGFPPGIVNGTLHVDDAAAAQARTSLLTAYNAASTLPPGITVAAGADLGAAYPKGIPPGTYTSGSTMLVSTPLTLDAGGDANAVWVFQIGSSLTTSASLLLANGARSGNIFWVPAMDATIGVNTVFHGTILAGRNVTGVTGATINGRILAGATTAGTIALDTNTVNVPSK